MKRRAIGSIIAALCILSTTTPVIQAADGDVENCCRLGNGIICCAREILDWLWDNGMPW